MIYVEVVEDQFHIHVVRSIKIRAIKINNVIISVRFLLEKPGQKQVLQLVYFCRLCDSLITVDIV